MMKSGAEIAIFSEDMALLGIVPWHAVPPEHQIRRGGASFAMDLGPVVETDGPSQRVVDLYLHARWVQLTDPHGRAVHVLISNEGDQRVLRRLRLLTKARLEEDAG